MLLCATNVRKQLTRSGTTGALIVFSALQFIRPFAAGYYQVTMPTETEIKCRLQPQQVAALATLLDTLAQPQGHSTLKNRYFDTPQNALANARAALRIRDNNGQCEQTLKTRGTSVAGLQQRGEWNWPLTGAALDLTLLQQDEVTAHWPAGVQASELAEIFATDFNRQRWLWQQDNAQVEIVIDTGTVSTGKKSVPLCELELELQQGDAAVLWQLLQQLSEQVPLWLSDVSKAERGYRLAGLSRSWQETVSFRRDEDLAQVLPRWLNAELQQWQRALEACLWDNDSAAALTALQHWQALRQLPQQAGKVLKRRDTKALREALDIWQAPLQQLATQAQLLAYLNSADEPGQTAAERKALQQQVQQQLQTIRNDAQLAQAGSAAAGALHTLVWPESTGATAARWLRHALQQQAPLLQRLHDQRPQDEEQWRGRQHDMALLCQSCDYLRGRPELGQGLGINGAGIGEGTLRVLVDMLHAQTLLQRPWPLAPLTGPDGQELRPLADYAGWAVEHLAQLAREL
ncbi:CYTH domain-containing protein [Oceanospirillaceae bacterium ASx5O]|nr:CYTH domain-containing protein [Oceanospirillaceae bacterium ASx5O]